MKEGGWLGWRKAGERMRRKGAGWSRPPLSLLGRVLLGGRDDLRVAGFCFVFLCILFAGRMGWGGGGLNRRKAYACRWEGGGGAFGRGMGAWGAYRSAVCLLFRRSVANRGPGVYRSQCGTRALHRGGVPANSAAFLSSWETHVSFSRLWREVTARSQKWQFFPASCYQAEYSCSSISGNGGRLRPTTRTTRLLWLRSCSPLFATWENISLRTPFFFIIITDSLFHGILTERFSLVSRHLKTNKPKKLKPC